MPCPSAVQRNCVITIGGSCHFAAPGFSGSRMEKSLFAGTRDVYPIHFPSGDHSMFDGARSRSVICVSCPHRASAHGSASSAAGRQIGEPCAVRRNPRRRVLKGPRGQRPVVLAVAGDDPQVAEPLIYHLVVPVQNVDHALSILGDLRIGHRAHVPKGGRIQTRFSRENRGGSKQKQPNRAHR